MEGPSKQEALSLPQTFPGNITPPSSILSVGLNPFCGSLVEAFLSSRSGIFGREITEVHYREVNKMIKKENNIP